MKIPFFHRRDQVESRSYTTTWLPKPLPTPQSPSLRPEPWPWWKAAPHLSQAP